ncbi:amidase [Virgibacillus litoralis]|uniref:Asp-tRNA(Asn)/Glu-tRNA(Gln) amidotransferase A subunit family amidase n=1 Tax=Virgibacillus litoralis TaxID=578221 RepID=A0ABS4HFU6_9BACI|nr:amidase [Virgibacillus litoralis]MBP1949809.1 Asp-tRNA(Asn)/Glu-tRNA(Gln) amidotransferase A subunit family amidase [Virgibacillus litoralis]
MGTDQSSVLSAQSILNMDASSIARAIKDGEITSNEAVNIYIEHLKKVNPAINAVVEEHYTEALREAQEKDNQNANVTKGPLFGVPISVKEAFNVENMKTTGGLLNRKHLIAREDADVVAKLKEAGAIILGKTNTPALCFCQETDNKLYGRTNNPWDVTRTAGGSSGGEGALLGAGGAAAGVGSDIGGSIRFPSHFKGVVGFKPGKFQVSSIGHFPADTIPLQKRMSGMGPMGKSVRDMELIYDIIANNSATEQSLDDFEIGILSDGLNIPLSQNTKDVVGGIESYLQKSVSVNRSTPPYFENSAQLWQEIMSLDGGKSMEKLAFNTDRSNVLAAYAKEKITRKTKIHPYLSWALIGAKLFKPSSGRIKQIEGIIEQGDREIAAYLNNRLLILPVYHTAAPEHGKLFQEIFSIRKTFLQYMPYIAYANVWGLPSLTIPAGTDENNMPIGIQVVSMNGNEDAIFKLGKIVERKFGGYNRCSRLD